RATCLNSGLIIFSNWAGSITSRISSISPRYITSLELTVLGQNLSSPSTTGSELHYTVGQLGVKHAERLGLVQRQQHLHEELLVLSLQRQRKSIDDAAQNLKQLANTIELLSLIDEPQENIINLLPNESSQAEKFAIDSVENSFQKVALSRIFAVEYTNRWSMYFLATEGWKSGDSSPFNLFRFQIGHGVAEVEHNSALLQLLLEQFNLISAGCIFQRRQRVQLSWGFRSIMRRAVRALRFFARLQLIAVAKWVGHTAAACKSPAAANRRTDQAVREVEVDQEEAHTLHVMAEPRTKIPPIETTVIIEETPVRMEIDTGASVSLISSDTFALSSVGCPSWSRPTHSYVREPVPLLGKINVCVRIGEISKELPLLVVKGSGSNLIGRDWLAGLPLDWRSINQARVALQQAMQKQQHDAHAHDRRIEMGDAVVARDFAADGRWKPAVVTNCSGAASFSCQFDDGREVRRHIDQVRKPPEPPAPSEAEQPPCVEVPDDQPEAPAETPGQAPELSSEALLRRSTRARAEPDRLRYEYSNEDRTSNNSSCSGGSNPAAPMKSSLPAVKPRTRSMLVVSKSEASEQAAADLSSPSGTSAASPGLPSGEDSISSGLSVLRELAEARKLYMSTASENAQMKQYVEDLNSECLELHDSLFQEANRQVSEALQAKDRVEKRCIELERQNEVLTSEVAALKALIEQASPSLSECGHRRTGSYSDVRQAEQLTDSDIQSFELDPLVYGEDIRCCLEFANRDLGAQVIEAALTNQLHIEALTSNRSAPQGKQRCSLMKSKLCHYRVRLSESSDAPWHYISHCARNRIIATCNLLHYLRYVQQGLLPSATSSDKFTEIQSHRRNMHLAMLGFQNDSGTPQSLASTPTTRSRLQSLADSDAGNADTAADSPSLATRRARIASELLESEEKYLRYLRLLTRYFEAPLRLSEDLMPADAHAAVFGNLAQIVQLNRHHMRAQAILERQMAASSRLLGFVRRAESRPEVQMRLDALLIMPVQRVPRELLELLQRQRKQQSHRPESTSRDSIGAAHAFCQLAPYLKIYSVYARHHMRAQAILERQMAASSRLLGFVRRAESRPEVQMRLDALLIMPVQRVP
uniref:DH domain-containing protein n=1 Tax=Macrostomum lignano TaxID=282301 RepID=A0A1I8IGB6_9PLAT